MSLEAYAERVLRERVQEPADTPLTRSQIAGKRTQELRKGVTLGGVSTEERSPGGFGVVRGGRAERNITNARARLEQAEQIVVKPFTVGR